TERTPPATRHSRRARGTASGAGCAPPRAPPPPRHKAMEAMRHEAAHVGAEGVVGVRLTLDLESWGEDLGEFLAVGTAVRRRGGGAQGKVFTSNLSGRDFSALLQGGYPPAAIVMGACLRPPP